MRNLIAIGNPIPYTTFGPLHLPMPERTFELRPGFSVFHYATDFRVWSDWFFPGLDDSFGLLWPLVLAAFIGGAVYAIWRGGDPLLRMLGVVVLVTAIAYVFTPLTAAGDEGQPIAFEWNVRYIAPAAAVGLAMLPCLPIARRTERARTLTLAGLVVLFAATAASLVQWQQGHVKGAVAAGACVLAGFAVIQWLRARGRWGARAPLRVARRAGDRGRAGRARAPAGGSSATTSSTATTASARSSTWPARSAGRATCATRRWR